MKLLKHFTKNPFFVSILICSSFLFLTFTGCDKSSGPAKVNEVLDTGVLKVGTSADYPPYEFHLLKDNEGEIVGLDIDIANAIAEDLGVKLEIKNIVFHKLFQALNTGEVDLVIAGLAPNEGRKELVDFSDVYYQAIQNMVIREVDSDLIKVLKDLRGKKVGTQRGSIQGDMVKKVVLGAEVIEKETVDELIQDLKEESIDAVILEKPVAESYVIRNKDLKNVVCNSGDFGEQLGSAIAVKKGNKDLLNEVNRILKKLKETNKIAEFVQDAMVLMMK